MNFLKNSICCQETGSSLVFLAIVLLILGMLSVAMVSMFSASVVGTAAPNEQKMAFYLSESGIRYAFSEIRNAENINTAISSLHDTIEFSTDSGSFEAEVFGLWFKYDSMAAGTLSVNVPDALITKCIVPGTDLFSIPVGAYVVAASNIEAPSGSGAAEISSYTRVDNEQIKLALNSAFTAGAKEDIYIAVKAEPPLAGATQVASIPNGSIYISAAADDFFPERDGAISINGKDYLYESKEYTSDVGTGNDGVILKRISKPYYSAPESWVTLGPSDFIVLSTAYNKNYMIYSTGYSGLKGKHLTFFNLVVGGLVSYWSFDDSADIGNDDYGVNDGAIKGFMDNPPTLSCTSSDMHSSSGNIKAGALNLENNYCYLDIPHSASLDMSNSDQVTVAAWVKKNSNQAGQIAILQKSNQSYTLFFENNQPGFAVYDGALQKALSSDAIVDDTSWHYIVGVFDGSEARIYVDNTQKGSAPASGVASVSDPMGIGENLITAGQFLDGRIDELRVWNRALTPEEIEAFYWFDQL